MRTHDRSTAATFVIIIPSLIAALSCADACAQTAPRAPEARATRFPAKFIENRGQVDASVAAYVAGADRKLFFTNDGVTIAVEDGTAGARRRHIIKLAFVGTATGAHPVLENPLPGTVNYFKGESKDWRAGIHTYQQLRYSDLWPGVDLVYTTGASGVKYQLELNPGADPDGIRFAIRGACGAGIGADGSLQIATSAGTLSDAAPIAWQTGAGANKSVPASFMLEPSASEPGTQILRFATGARDASLPLVIDPVVVVQSSFLGGAGSEYVRAVAVDPSGGGVVVAGSTNSSEITFPAATGPDLTYGGASANGIGDAFVAKVDAAGTTLVYCSYLGGSLDDSAQGVAVDTNGNAYICGYTESTTGQGFPATVGPDLTYNGGARDAFVAKIDGAGTALVYCGYIGGARDEKGFAIAVDSLGNAYVGGETNSDQTTFPAAVGPDLTYNGINTGAPFGFDTDCFIAKVNSNGLSLGYCGYIGSAGGFDGIRGVAVDSNFNCYVGGAADVLGTGFPAVVGPKTTPIGVLDGFVAKLNPAGSALTYCGFVGGTSQDYVTSVAIDSQGRLCFCGTTISNDIITKTGPNLTFGGGTYDGFAGRVAADGASLDFIGYVGGFGIDQCAGVAVDGNDIIYISGDTSTFGLGVGTTGNFGSLHGTSNLYVGRLAANGSAFDYLGYVGSTGFDSATGLAVDAGGNAYVVGQVGNAGANPSGGFDSSFGGGSGDGFLAKISVVPVPPPTMDIAIHKGSLSDSTKTGKDTFSAAGIIQFNGNSPDAAFDPTLDDVTLTIGPQANPYIVTVPAASLGWKIKKGKYTYKSPAKTLPKVSLVFDFPKKKLSINVSKFDLPSDVTNPIEVDLVAGNDDGSEVKTWTNKKPGKFKLP
ncbi:MAG: SBBP repeat-containing protein [Planctomycetes bacterium]|nr:SBBP repeat-containing protein [Planctomycetota bacterium]